MTQAKHTPGPWEVGSLNQGPVSGTIPITTPGYRETFRDGMLIASVYGTAARSEANARLIAAAPDGYALAEQVAAIGDETFRARTLSEREAALLNQAILMAKAFLYKVKGE